MSSQDSIFLAYLLSDINAHKHTPLIHAHYAFYQINNKTALVFFPFDIIFRISNHTYYIFLCQPVLHFISINKKINKSGSYLCVAACVFSTINNIFFLHIYVPTFVYITQSSIFINDMMIMENNKLHSFFRTRPDSFTLYTNTNLLVF